MGTSGGTSVTAMVACCLHHVTDVLPILGLSAAATFLTRYQPPFMLVGLGMNLIGIVLMLVILVACAPSQAVTQPPTPQPSPVSPIWVAA